MRRALLALLFVGCVEHRGGIEGTQSLRIELVSPADPGAPDRRLPDTQRMVTVNITALDAQGAMDPTFNNAVQVYAQFLGTLTPQFGQMPLATAQATNGVATNVQVTLPNVFGPTTLWIDDAQSAGATFATGNSPTLWFRDPFIADLQTPRSEMALDALSVSPLQDKQIRVDASRYGTKGRLVVTSVFAQGYTVSDVQCADDQGTPPCTSQAYDHVEVFSFSAPRDQRGRVVQEGQIISGFAGGISEFNGLTEIGFPQTFGPDADQTDIKDCNTAGNRCPLPVLLDPLTWFKGLSDPQGEINFERNEAAAITVMNGKVCNLDEDFDTFKQWKVDPAGTGGDCSKNDNVLNVITTGITAVDPTMLVGKTIKKVVGVVRPVELPGFNVWIIFPRSAADVQQ